MPNSIMRSTYRELPIRRATLADEASILALAPRLVAFGPPPWREVEGMRATDRRVLSAALRSTADDPLVLVAVCSDSDVAGFIHIRSARDYHTPNAITVTSPTWLSPRITRAGNRASSSGGGGGLGPRKGL